MIIQNDKLEDWMNYHESPKMYQLSLKLSKKVKVEMDAKKSGEAKETI